MTIFLVDISSWQSGINVEAIVNEGFSGVFCKASEGVGYVDPTFDDFATRAKNAGAIPGAYHFLRAGDGRAQAHIFRDLVAAVGGPDGFLCACDNEADASYDTTLGFVDEWNAITNNHPLLMYTGAWWWVPRGWDGVSLTPYLWHSQYVSGTGYASDLYANVPDSWWTPGYGGWGEAKILQFSDKASVAGWSIDVDAFRGTIDELRALARTSSGGITPGGPMAGETADWAASHVPNPADGSNTGLHIAEGEIWKLVIDNSKKIAELLARPSGSVTLTTDQIATIKQGLAEEVASLLAPKFKNVDAILQRLGEAGDALGKLND